MIHIQQFTNVLIQLSFWKKFKCSRISLFGIPNCPWYLLCYILKLYYLNLFVLLYELYRLNDVLVGRPKVQLHTRQLFLTLYKYICFKISTNIGNLTVC